jgi:amino acid permease
LPQKTRYVPTWVTWLLVVAGFVCLAAAVVYFVRPASELPSFFPGHDASLARHHTTHGIAMVVAALLCWAGAWLSGGTPASRPSDT